MNLDNVIELTRALGICELTSKPKQDIHYSLTIQEMLRFAKLVADYERNECAKVCDELETNSDAEFYGYEFSKAIRERGKS